jgi:S1-C subfamily serine protease
MRGWYLSLGWAAALPAACWIACASEPPPRSEPAAVPIPLGPGGSRTLTFLHVVTRIPAGSLLGVARWKNSGLVLDEIRATGGAGRSNEYNVAITDLLRSYGYTVRDEADAVFEPTRSVRVRYQLAAVIHKLEVEYVYQRPHRSRAGVKEVPSGFGTAEVELELQVHDVVRKQTVFQRTYRGRGRDEGTEPQPVVPAVVDAVRNALADARFVAAVAEPEQPVDSVPPAVTSITRCRARPAPLPRGMRETLDSVVVVRAGATSGGGVIVSEDGHVITAEHVVGDAEEVFVSLRSGPRIPARVIGRSSSRDLALLELPGHGYACAPLTNMTELPTGSEIFTINILLDERAPTVTRGVVSGYQVIRGRRYIQTDASINRGSSGSPLFDRTGKVGGIVTDKVVGVGLEGIGLGVPIDEADHSLAIQWE